MIRLLLALLLLLLISLANAQAQTPDITVIRDKFDIRERGSLSKVEIFQDKFFCVFATTRKNTWIAFNRMIVLSSSGQFIEDVFLPWEIVNMSRYDLIVEQDSLFIKHNELAKYTYALDPYVPHFKQVADKKFNIYQDNNYNISSECRGEYGGTIYFENKHTSTKYEGSATCPVVVNKIGNTFYVTNYLGHLSGSSSVLKIEEPERLAKVDSDSKIYGGSKHYQGIETLLKARDIKISTSFVIDNKLVHLYTDDEGTYLCKIDNQKLNAFYKFDFRFDATLNQQLSGGKQVLTCHFKDTNKFGILIIDGNRFTFHEFQ